jgi:hypothetical protein
MRQAIRHMEAPRPELLAAVQMACLVDVHHRLPGQGGFQFRMTGAQDVAGLLDDRGDAGRWKASGPGRRPGGSGSRSTACPLLKGQQGLQPRPGEPGQPHLLRQRHGDHLAGGSRPIQPRAMLRQLEERLDQGHLLRGARLVRRFPVSSRLRPLVRLGVVHLLRRKQRAGMFLMSRLDAPALLAASRCQPSELDDVAGDLDEVEERFGAEANSFSNCSIRVNAAASCLSNAATRMANRAPLRQDLRRVLKARRSSPPSANSSIAVYTTVNGNRHEDQPPFCSHDQDSAWIDGQGGRHVRRANSEKSCSDDADSID